MDELEKITSCPMCAHHCPIDSTSCRRGNDYAAWLYQAKEELRERERTNINDKSANSDV